MKMIIKIARYALCLVFGGAVVTFAPQIIRSSMRSNYNLARVLQSFGNAVQMFGSASNTPQILLRKTAKNIQIVKYALLENIKSKHDLEKLSLAAMIFNPVAQMLQYLAVHCQMTQESVPFFEKIMTQVDSIADHITFVAGEASDSCYLASCWKQEMHNLIFGRVHLTSSQSNSKFAVAAETFGGITSPQSYLHKGAVRTACADSNINKKLFNQKPLASTPSDDTQSISSRARQARNTDAENTFFTADDSAENYLGDADYSDLLINLHDNSNESLGGMHMPNSLLHQTNHNINDSTNTVKNSNNQSGQIPEKMKSDEPVAQFGQDSLKMPDVTTPKQINLKTAAYRQQVIELANEGLAEVQAASERINDKLAQAENDLMESLAAALQRPRP